MEVSKGASSWFTGDCEVKCSKGRGSKRNNEIQGRFVVGGHVGKHVFLV